MGLLFCISPFATQLHANGEHEALAVSGKHASFGCSSGFGQTLELVIAIVVVALLPPTRKDNPTGWSRLHALETSSHMELVSSALVAPRDCLTGPTK